MWVPLKPGPTSKPCREAILQRDAPSSPLPLEILSVKTVTVRTSDQPRLIVCGAWLTLEAGKCLLSGVSLISPGQIPGVSASPPRLPIKNISRNHPMSPWEAWRTTGLETAFVFSWIERWQIPAASEIHIFVECSLKCMI